MKIKDIKGIVSKLPKKQHPEMSDSVHHTFALEREYGYDMALDEVLNTDIDINDIVELDVEKIKEVLKRQGTITDEDYEYVAKAIAEAKPYKEKK